MRTKFAIWATIILAAAVTASPVSAEIGRVKSSVGDAKVRRGAGQPVAVAPGFQLEQSDVIVTGPTGRMGVTLTDDTRIAVGPKSTIVLATYKYDRTRQTGQMVTEVNRGSLGVVSGKIAKSAKDAMKVRTPTSMLGVRGTRFVVDVQ